MHCAPALVIAPAPSFSPATQDAPAAVSLGNEPGQAQAPKLAAIREGGCRR